MQATNSYQTKTKRKQTNSENLVFENWLYLSLGAEIIDVNIDHDNKERLN
jgi:hypothetical protein